MKYKCPCCGYMTFDEEIGETYEICPVCYWQDDSGYVYVDVEVESGANGISLQDARRNFSLFGAIKMEFVELVRDPRDYEICE